MSPEEAAPKVAEIFADGGRCSLVAREDRAFPNNGWLPLGDVSLASAHPPDDPPTIEGLAVLVRNGAFEWRLPEAEKSKGKLSECLGLEKEKENDNVDRALADIASIGVRTGLLHPIFDPASLEEMPFRRSTTVVTDTSGVLQGALGFVAQHLPRARVKVPAIVQMEIVNSAERFFGIRRSRDNEGRRVRGLIEHLKSQGGQRTLVRLEIRTDTEIERTWLLGDPLRDAFKRERDRELTNLDLSVPFAPYVDRLILEAARRHQAESGPGHRVRLLTADQGLARMALAEGMSPLHFRRVEAEDFFGRRLTGQTFDPFTGQIRRTPLPAVLWEIATAFGSARLEGENGRSFIVSALGEGPPWSPYHSVDDLLWCRSEAADACVDPSSRSSRQSRNGPKP